MAIKQKLPNETIGLLRQSAHDIKFLREQNKIMKVRLDMFDDCMALLSVRVERSGQGVSPDLVWEIEKHIKDNLDIEE